MSDHGTDSTHEHHGDFHLVPVRYLAATGVALLILTVVTVWVAKFDFGDANIWVALAVAGVKASLVVLFFMHLRWDRPFNAFVFVGSIFFVLLFIAFALTDTTEYDVDVIPGDGPRVTERITQLGLE